MVGDPFIQTGRPSTKVFTVADGHKTPGSTEAKLHDHVRELARTVDMAPALADRSFLSGNKFAQAGYVIICDNKEVNIYDGQKSKIVVSEEAVLKEWFFPKSRMWLIPLQPHIIYKNTDTLLLNGPTGTESLNTKAPGRGLLWEHETSTTDILFATPLPRVPNRPPHGVIFLPTKQRTQRHQEASVPMSALG